MSFVNSEETVTALDGVLRRERRAAPAAAPPPPPPLCERPAPVIDHAIDSAGSSPSRVLCAAVSENSCPAARAGGIARFSFLTRPPRLQSRVTNFIVIKEP